MISENCCLAQGPEGTEGLPLGLESTCDAQRDGTHLPDVFAAWEYRPYSVSFLERVWKFLHRLKNC